MDAALTLQQEEGVLLATALVDYVATSAGIPALFIKGPAAGMMGLRDDHVSADVDVLVRPEDSDALCGLLGARGWRERPAGISVVREYLHSRTLYHPHWNCDIDVHDRFPGMEAPAIEAFATLWQDRQTLDMAGRKVPVPSVPAAVIFQALHSLRGMDDARHRREYSVLLQRVHCTLQQDLVDLSMKLQATAALAPFLEELGVDELPDGGANISEEWRHRTSVQGTGTAYLVELAESPWRAKPRVLARAIFPSRQSLRHDNLYLDETIGGMIKAYTSRWARGAASLPAAARRIRASRRQ